MIFTATMVVFAGLTRSKFDLLAATELRSRGQIEAEAVLDRLRLRGLPGTPTGQADTEGFRRVREFVVADRLLPGGRGVIEARALRMREGAGHAMLEARVTVSWREAKGRGVLHLSTLVPRKGSR